MVHSIDASARPFPLTPEELLTHRDWVRRFCAGLVGESDADDVAQDTWVAAVRRGRSGNSRTRAWLASVARSVALDRRRRDARRRRRDREAAHAEALPDTTESVERGELVRVALRELLDLREPFRSTLLMCYVEGRSHAEIAAATGVARATVRTRISRGLEELRRRLDVEHQGERRRWMAVLAPLTSRAHRPLRHAGWAAASVAVLTAAAFQLADPIRDPAATITAPVDDPALQVAQEDGPLASPAAQETQRTPVAATAPESKAGERPLIAPRVRWSRAGGQSGSPVVIDDRIVHSGNGIALLHADTGEVIWERTAEELGRWLSVTAVADELLIAQHMSGGYAAFRQKDGTVAWSRSREELGASFHHGGSVNAANGLFVLPTSSGLAALRTSDGTTVWTCGLDAAVEVRPAVAGDRAIAGTPSGTVAAVRLRDGEVLWRYESKAQFGWTDPVAVDGVVYIGDRGIGGTRRQADTGKSARDVEGPRAGAVNALRIDDGELLWSSVFGATGLAEPYPHGDDVWIGSGRTVRALDRATGAFREGRSLRTGMNPFGTPRVLGDQIVFGNLDGHLYAHRASDLEQLWRIALPGEGQMSGWTAAHDRIYVSSTLGLIALEDPPEATPLPMGTVVTATSLPKTPAPRNPGAAPQKQLFVDGERLVREMLVVLHPSALQDHERRHLQLEEGETPSSPDATTIEDRFATLRQWLAGSSTPHRRAALRVISRCGKVQGIEALRDDVLPHAREGTAAQRTTALFALQATGSKEGDVALVHAAWSVAGDAEKPALVRMMSTLDGGTLVGRSEELVLAHLEGIGSEQFRDLGSYMWGSSVGDELAARLVELATDPGFRYDAIYYVLSTMRDKQSSVVDVLLEAAKERGRSTDRAVWGLTYGVREEDRQRVVEAMIELTLPRPHEAKRVVDGYGTEEQKLRFSEDR